MTNIITEKRNKNSVNIDLATSLEIVEIMNNEDKKVALAVETEKENIAKAIDIITEGFLNGGSLLYFGAGTSGRLGILDASECPPTFGVAPDMVRGYIAGGDRAIKSAIEGAEDNAEQALIDFSEINPSENDVIVGISASGNAKYIIAILKKAQETGIKTIGIACNKEAKMKEFSDIFIAPEVGEEVVTGSTRLKSGTAQKMALNILTTGSMIKIGKTYENFMVDVQPTNEKLKDRAVRIVSEITETDHDMAKKNLETSDYKVKTAVIMIEKQVTKEEAENLLKKSNGILRKII